MNEVLKAIMDRRSTRGFTDQQITVPQMKALVDAALASPSARNLQYWHFSVVQKRRILDEMNADLSKIISEKLPEGERGRFNDSGFHVFYHAPTVIFISIPEESDNHFAEIDAGVAAENIAIAAQGLGLGSVIVGMVRDLFLSERAPHYHRLLGFPKGYRFAIAVVVGHNTVTKEPHPIGEGKVNYVR